jgi:hypothetical protein
LAQHILLFGRARKIVKQVAQVPVAGMYSFHRR